VPRWVVVIVGCVLLLADACSSNSACTQADDRLDACTDGGSDATTLPDATDAGGPPVCACPKPDAALLAPSACCAGSSCVAMHYDGLSSYFYDCYGMGSFVTPLALDACNAHFDASVACSATTCGLAEVVQGKGTECVTWAYQGADTSLWGHVRAAATCECPEAGDPSWY
jgi:hypothetical protein